MKIADIISEEMSSWGQDWVHYTKHPMLMINPKPSHMDPSGIYFFPASVTPDAEMWHVMPYKFTVNIRPDARLLDAARVTEQQIWQLMDAAGIREAFAHYLTQYPPQDIHKMFDMGWEMLQRHYFLDLYRKPAAFNAMLRRQGYDAVFDDKGAIHIGEPQQLLVLDPRIITNVRMTQRSGSGFGAVEKVVKDLTALGSQYGQVTVSPITKPGKNAYWTDRDSTLMAQVEIRNPQNPENNYCVFSVGVQKQFPDRVYVSVRYAHPSLGYGSGTDYSISKQQYTRNYGSDGVEKFRHDLDKIFARQQVAA